MQAITKKKCYKKLAKWIINKFNLNLLVIMYKTNFKLHYMLRVRLGIIHN